ncbi:zinc finger protein 574 [Aplochiton taeniatus]
MESSSVYMCFPCYQEFDTLDEVLKHQLTCTEEAAVSQLDAAENEHSDISLAQPEQLIGQAVVESAMVPQVLPQALVSDGNQTQPTINIRSLTAEMPRILYQCGDCDELFNTLDLWQHHRKEGKCLQEKHGAEPLAEEWAPEDPATRELAPEVEAEEEPSAEGGEGSSKTSIAVQNTTGKASPSGAKESRPKGGQEDEEEEEEEEETTGKSAAMETEDSPYRKRLATKKARPKSLLCVDCGASFSLVPELVTHRKTQHGLQEALHRCTVCGECFLNTTLFLYHRKQHRQKDADDDDPRAPGEGRPATEEVLEESAEGGPPGDGAAEPVQPGAPAQGQPDSYLCAMCGRSSSSESGLSAHRKEQHGLEEPLHHCSQCGQDFMNTTQYLYHRKTHGAAPAGRVEVQPGAAPHTPKRMRTSLGPASEPDVPVAKRGTLVRGNDGSLTTAKEELEESSVSDSLNLPAPSKLVQDWARTSLPHICPHCGKTFTRRVHLRAHVYNHTKEKLFSCKVCNKSFTTSQNLVRHAMTHKGTAFPCNLCGKDFSQAATLKRHHARFHSEAAKKKHGRGRRRQVTRYPLLLPVSPLKGDVLDDSEGNGHVFACLQCTARFNTVDQLRDHSLLHTDLPFPCAVCGEAFKRRKELDLHALTHEDKMPASCPNCQALFINQSVLDIHMQRCLCPDEDRAAGRGRGQGRGRSTGQMECDLCGHCCMTQDGLDLHRLSHTGQTPLKCPVTPCRRRFASNQALEDHVLSHTLNAVNKARPRRVLRCQVCYKDFAYVSTFNVHMRTHTNERPFGCSTCGKRFRQLPHLQDHERIHSGLKPFSCWVCGKSFSVAARLTEHARTHSGEKPYACRYCPAAFRSRSNLDKHARAHGELVQQEAEEAEGARVLSSLAHAAASASGDGGATVQTILLVQGAEGTTGTVVIPGDAEHAGGHLITGPDGSSQMVFLHSAMLAGAQTISIPTITMEGDEVTMIDGQEVPQHTIEFIMEETV